MGSLAYSGNLGHTKRRFKVKEAREEPGLFVVLQLTENSEIDCKSQADFESSACPESCKLTKLIDITGLNLWPETLMAILREERITEVLPCSTATGNHDSNKYLTTK